MRVGTKSTDAAHRTAGASLERESEDGGGEREGGGEIVT